MTPKALKALKGSIRKWQRIVNGTGKDRGADNCPLCKAYPRLDCAGCPVKKATGYDQCAETPYRDYRRANIWGSAADALISAKRELNFLKSLLPARK